MAHRMNVSTNAIEKKILSLKTQYKRELNKLKTKSGAGLDEKTHSNWYAFEYLHFLNDANGPHPRTNSLLITETESKLEGITVENKSREEPTLSFSQRQSQPRFILKRKCDAQLGTLNLLKGASNANIVKQKKDSFSIFGDTIASELRDIKNKRELLILKKDIMDLIFHTKLRILEPEYIISQPPFEED
ncbi:unnamed protein product [Parnassius apollo]|uniref:(apollo) hypothetical protein n=1 Tax=Parnassius apollo TaxID=110799 RepID=A0A8S3WIA7_PARAO|nr:unnamed protein product [Parnassius apollo]